MASLTAIEFGADTCAMARTAVRRGEVRVFAADALDPRAFPGDEAFTAAIRQARIAMKLPRRAHVVLWGLAEGSHHEDAEVKPLLAPLANAGFRVEQVVTPCNALAALARVRAPRGEGATCWLAINRGGVAIVVVRPGTQIYAHSLAWDSNIGSVGSQARLLQRYSQVSFVSPEVKRAMAEARKAGTPVSAIVTCGNLPDLRSLTMPLIEELDLEVETLDSLDGLVVTPGVADKLADSAPAIRLACAGAITREPRPPDESKRRAAHRKAALLRAAVIIAIVSAASYAWYRLRDAPTTASVSPSPVTQPSAPLPAPSAVPQPAAPLPARNRRPRLSSIHSRLEPIRPARVTAPAASAPTDPMPALLKDDIPRVTSILVANDRRFATIDARRIVGVGDVIGRRVVVEIDEKTLVLREPSGLRVRIGLGGRVLGVERGR